MDRRITILIAEDELSEREKLKNLLANEPDLEVVALARDGKECLDQVERLRPQVCLIKENLPVINGLEAAERIGSQFSNSAVILILTGTEGEEIWHKMLRAGIKEFLTRPIVAERLLQEVRRVAKPAAPAAAPPGAVALPESAKHKVITVTGPRGGCGKTVIATNLAVAMAAASEKIALVDLNLWGGDVAMLLDLAPRRTLGDLLPGFGGIDYDVVEAMMVKHSSGVSVLAAPLTGTFDGASLSKYMVQSILEALRQHYECTIVDTGYANLESTLAAMDYSDVILVCVGMDLPRLRDGKLYLKNLLAANYPREKLRVVVNRVGVSREISAAEVESILDFPVVAQLPSDDVLVTSAVNLGQPFVTSNPSKQLSRALLNLAEQIGPPALAAKKKKGGLFRSLFLH